MDCEASLTASLQEPVYAEVELRQWVLTFPLAWRRRLAQDYPALAKRADRDSA